MSRGTQRRYLIALGFPRCEAMGLEPLEHVESDVRRVADYFVESQGFTRVLADRIPNGATARTVRSELSHWFADELRDSDDVVVVYVAGHGGSAGKASRHHVFTSESDPRQPGETAVETARLGQIFFDGEGRRPQNVMLILDTCYAGKGGGQAAAMVAEATASIQDEPGCGFWIIASASPTSGAGDGVFVSAFLDAMENEVVSPRGGAEFVDPVTLVEEINRWFLEHKHPQQARVDAVGAGQGNRPFLQNPNFTHRHDGMPLADEGHWNPKGRGVEEFSSAGWFFTGREHACRVLVRHLETDTWDGRARVVTGRPGSGKSALLGWLVLCAHKESRSAMEQAGMVLSSQMTPAVGTIDAAIHARGLSVEDALQQLTARLNIPQSELTAVLRRLAARERPVRILVDGIDESTEPSRLEHFLLQPLAECKNVRLIVGSRRLGDRIPLNETADIVDLDSRAYLDLQDIAAYVEARLTKSFPPTGYADDRRHSDARRIAQRIAQKSDGSFLYARVVSRRIATEPPRDTELEGWERELPLPDALNNAFDLDLDRFPSEERKRFVDLLVPLAYSRGKGLPQKYIWALVASRLARRHDDHPYSNGDIRELKQKAGFYIIQDTEHGEVVYRLFHEAFAEYLRALTRDESVELTIAETLWGLDDPPLGHGGWLRRSDPYIVRHLASHAAAGRLLESLMRDEEALVRLSPASLLPHLATITEETLRATIRAYRKASVSLRSNEESDRRAYLSMAMLQEGLQHPFPELREKASSCLWMPVWARWTLASSNYAICNANSRITVAENVEWTPEKDVVLIGREDGSVEVWDILTGEQMYSWRPASRGQARHLSMISTAQGHFLVVLWVSGDLSVVSLATGREEKWQRPDSEEGKVTAFCTGLYEGRPVCVIAMRDCRLRVCDLPSLRIIKERSNATAASIYALKLSRIGEELLLFSGGDCMRDGSHIENSLLRIWSFPDLGLLWEDGRADNMLVEYIEFGYCDGRMLLIASARWGPFRIWDPVSRKLLYDSETSSSQRVMFVELEGKGYLVSPSGTHLAVSRICDGPEFYLEKIRDDIVVDGLSFSALQLHGRPILLTLLSDHICVWDLVELLVANSSDVTVRRSGLIESITALTIGRTATRELYVATNGGELVSLDRDSGIELWRVDLGAGNGIVALNYLTTEGADLLVAARHDGVILTIDPETRKNARPPIKAGDAIAALAACEWWLRVLAFVTVESRGDWAVRVWDLNSAKEVTPHAPFSEGDRWSLRWGQEDKVLYGLAIGVSEDAIRVSFAGKYGKVMVGNFRKSLEEDLQDIRKADGRTFEEWKIPISDDGYTYSLAVVRTVNVGLLAAGTDNGELIVWNYETGEAKAMRRGAHLGSIGALLFDGPGGMLVSGGHDGHVRFWTKGLNALCEINIGDRVTAATWLDPNHLAIGTNQGTLMLFVNKERMMRRGEAAVVLRTQAMLTPLNAGLVEVKKIESAIAPTIIHVAIEPRIRRPEDVVISDLRGRRPRLEQHYQLKIADSALEFAAKFEGLYPWPNCGADFALIDAVASMTRLDRDQGPHWKLDMLDKIQSAELHLSSISSDLEIIPTPELRIEKEEIEAKLMALRLEHERDTAAEVILAARQLEAASNSPSGIADAIEALCLAKLRHIMDCQFAKSGTIVDAHVAVYLAREAKRAKKEAEKPSRRPTVEQVIDVARDMGIID
jgi:WD40 repeat protein